MSNTAVTYFSFTENIAANFTCHKFCVHVWVNLLNCGIYILFFRLPEVANFAKYILVAFKNISLLTSNIFPATPLLSLEIWNSISTLFNGFCQVPTYQRLTQILKSLSGLKILNREALFFPQHMFWWITLINVNLNHHCSLSF